MDRPCRAGRRRLVAVGNCRIGGTVARYSPVFPSGNTVSMTVDMTLLPGLDNAQFWYRDPAFGGCGGQFFNLSNALTSL